MAISGHLSRKMIEHYSHIRMEAKRAALDAIASQAPPPTAFQNRNQISESVSASVANSLN
jgi:hypothetical protein